MNQALTLLKPVFQDKADTVEIKIDAENEYTKAVLETLESRVFGSGCTSVCYCCFFLFQWRN